MWIRVQFGNYSQMAQESTIKY